MYFNREVSMERKPEKINSEFPINKLNLFTAIPIVLLNLGILYILSPAIYIFGNFDTKIPLVIGNLVIQIIALVWFVWQVKYNGISRKQIYAKQKRKVNPLTLVGMQFSDLFFFNSIFIFTALLTASESTNQLFFGLGKTEMVIWSVNAVIFTPVVEEIVFRLIIMNKVKTKYGKNRAIIISSVLFSLFHISNGWQNMIHALFLGFFYAVVYEYTGSLKASTIMHMLNNGMVVLFIFLSKPILESFIYIADFSSSLTILIVIASASYIVFFFAYYYRKISKLNIENGNSEE